MGGEGDLFRETLPKIVLEAADMTDPEDEDELDETEEEENEDQDEHGKS